jgi:hypothetical protein
MGFTERNNTGSFIRQRLETSRDFSEQVAFSHFLPPIHAWVFARQK